MTHKHRCMRCREEFECRNPGVCRAGYDVLPVIVIPSGNTADSYEHCPMPRAAPGTSDAEGAT